MSLFSLPVEMTTPKQGVTLRNPCTAYSRATSKSTIQSEIHPGWEQARNINKTLAKILSASMPDEW
ncbi:MAG: hypothetical protein LJE70_16125 [Chromatiaceae bacterium]|nr:hypothetical protein [Chromatiaceae bacterium]